MDTRTVLEIIGWIGSGLVVISLVVANQYTFRWMNFSGSFIATTYNAILGVWPAVGMNAAIVLIDVYWLLRLRRQEAEKQAAVETTQEVDAGRVDAPGIEPAVQ
ncbi:MULTISPECIES: YgjV family protein [unclassified Actinobaculum]|uniref:YgjV family protein n=1 Tax=unclassified Actinobaculum TaxID=2609299 RepID=UPI000D52675D|nr:MULTISPECIES: YgjV family protein [unclassified Actinobaculum]AWE41717.1 hypothetical protein DDD63_01875 [Actinobaculum sp. 313]RTE50373.1 hypothetical protein EKN07_04025 [Actinobaculum sp. 352]